MKPAFVAERRSEYIDVRERIAGRAPKAAKLNYAESIDNGLKLDWQGYRPPVPNQLGVQVFEAYDLRELVNYIDWTPFFISWSLAGKFPAILDDEIVGEAARDLYGNATSMLAQLIDGNLLTAKAVFSLTPAARIDTDSVAIYADESRGQLTHRFEHLRQQSDKATGKANLSLADFIALRDSPAQDYLGGFTVSIFGAEELAHDYKAKGDDFNAILVQSLADRLAEAFAERLHERVRKEFWGYAADEALDNAALIKEKYQGIRPAPGYPACPEHSEKAVLFDWLGSTARIGTILTENYAMWPPSSVSGFYYSHPQSEYFNVGKISRDQLESYAVRKGWSVETAERWLSPNLE
jgi:5-methyltetrahydrofolate--homocysteine methyltransferase